MKRNPFTYVISLLLFFGNLKAQSDQSTDPSFKVLTFNILHGATTRNDFNLDRIARIIQSSEADLVALQEVDFKTARAKGYDLATELAWRTKLTPYFAMAMPYDGGAYGEAVLSRWPIIASKNISLPYFENHEPRAVALIKVALPTGDTILFAGTHLDHLRDDRDRFAQSQAINEALIPTQYPILLAGDLNDTHDSRSIQYLNSIWSISDDEGSPTHPSNDPHRKIDYILYYPRNRWQVLDAKVICDEIASDHCAVLVHLQLE